MELESDIRSKILSTFSLESDQLQARSPPDWSAMEDRPGIGDYNVCHLCEKAFTGYWRAGHLKEHLLTHRAEKPNKRGTCEKAFSKAGHRKEHLLTHSGEKSHKCGTCEKAFTRAGDLKKHLLTHSGEKPHECGTCEKSFTQAEHRKRHLLTHHQRQRASQGPQLLGSK